VSEKTYIKGKDRDLESTIDMMQKKLQDIGIEMEILPVLHPVDCVYSVHIRDKECNLLFTNGKGASEKATIASAFGEFFERLSCHYFFADYFFGEAISSSDFVHYPNEKWFTIEDDEQLAKDMVGVLNAELWEYFDKDNELLANGLFDVNTGVTSRGICTLPFINYRDKRVCYFPVNIIGNIFVSNGMAAGNSVNEARTQALSEIIERWVKNKIITQGIALPAVPDFVIARYPHIRKSLEELEGYGYHLRVCDASLGGAYPVLSVTLINHKNASVLASFGAHPSFEVAFERTVTELLQGRTLDMLDDFSTPSFDKELVLSDDNIEAHFINSTGLISYDFFKNKSDFSFVDWDNDLSTTDAFHLLSNKILENGNDIYIADYEQLGVYTCRILVPGVSDIYPIEDLVYRNNNEGVYFREAFLSLENITEDDLEILREALDDSDVSDTLNVCEFIGVIPDEKSAWKTLQIGELKAMFALALGDLTMAEEWVRWVVNMQNIDQGRMGLYRCLDAILSISQKGYDFGSYEDILVSLYSQDIVDLTLRIIARGERFYGLGTPGLSLNGFNTHRNLLKEYEKIHLKI